MSDASRVRSVAATTGPADTYSVFGRYNGSKERPLHHEVSRLGHHFAKTWQEHDKVSFRAGRLDLLKTYSSNTRWSGGTGRRTGLKIPRALRPMRVRPPPPAPALRTLFS